MSQGIEKHGVSKDSLKTHFILGIVGSPFGLEGFVKVRPFSGETGHFFNLDKVTLSQNGTEKILNVAEIVPRGEILLMRFSGIDSPEAAGVLKGARIIAGREYAAPLKEGEYYVEDLKGLEVVNGEGEVLGLIMDIAEGGGGQLAEVLLYAGGEPKPARIPAADKEKTRFVPFRKEFFGDISPENGKIVLLEPWILDQ